MSFQAWRRRMRLRINLNMKVAPVTTI